MLQPGLSSGKPAHYLSLRGSSLFLPQVLQQQPCNAFRARLCHVARREEWWGESSRPEERRHVSTIQIMKGNSRGYALVKVNARRTDVTAEAGTSYILPGYYLHDSHHNMHESSPFISKPVSGLGEWWREKGRQQKTPSRRPVPGILATVVFMLLISYFYY